jgi:predicted nuclease of predicted toxin-antitoxin system
VAHWLRDQQHDVFYVYEQERGMDDDDIIHKAFTEERILITNDKDFGEKVYRERRPHRGVVLLRLDDERVTSKIAVLQHLLASYPDLLAEQFVVVTDTAVRVARG